MLKKLHVHSFLTLILAYTSVAFSGEAIDFTISIPPETTYVSCGALPIICTFKNPTESSASFLMPGFQDDYYSAAPGFLRSKVWDESGRLLTVNSIDKDGWWSVRALDSQEYMESEDDRITLGSGESYSLEVDLSEILKGCDALKGPLESGSYRVQLDSAVGESNKLVIEIREAVGSTA